MKDYVLKALIAEGEILSMVAVSTNLVEEATRRHKALPTAASALGRVLTLTAILGTTLKERQKISIQILTRGPLKEIYAQSDWKGNVRGYVKWPFVHFPPTKDGKLNVEGATGRDGMLYVVKDLGFGEPYVGSVTLKTGGIAKDLAYYFALSEGIPSAVGAGVYVNTDGSVLGAGGFIVQPLPGASNTTISTLEKNIESIPSISKFIYEGAKPEDILEKISGSLEFEILTRLNIRYRCSCSKRRAERAILTLGMREILDMIDKDRRAEVKCEFCGKIYNFTEEELKKILMNIPQKGPPS
jgi:molecular chaperone Hsp33